MFGFLKNKIKEWIGKSKEKVEEKVDVTIKEKKIKEKKQKKEKVEEKFKKEKTKEEIKEERELGKHIIEDIKREQEEKPEEAEKENKGFFARIKDRFSYKLQEEDFNEMFESLEEILIQNNTAIESIEYIKQSLKKELLNVEIKKSELEQKIKEALKISIETMFPESFSLLDKIKEKQETPFVILFVGINGSGKTTTIAKISHMLTKNKISNILAAADTFRAASIEQLSKHAEKLGVEIVKSSYGSDPTSVAFDAIKHAKARKLDAVLIDTAGRMHTKENLIREMEKISRVCKPDLKIFIAESITGNDAVEQARIFNEAIGIDGIILSKSDVDEKGGAALSVSYITKKPILFLGTGQEYKDLQVFDKKKFVKSLGL